jgi:hypothetical protein
LPNPCLEEEEEEEEENSELKFKREIWILVIIVKRWFVWVNLRFRLAKI